MRIVILGAGFGGLEIATRLSEALGDDAGVAADIVVIDRNDAFVAGAAHIDLLVGNTELGDVRRLYSTFSHRGVRFVRSDIHRIDPGHRRVDVADGSIEADVIVIALGAEIDVTATPGLAEDGCEFYTVPGVLAARRALSAFTGGKIVVGVCSTTYKCPPAPSAATLAVHDALVARGLRDETELALVMPTSRPIPPSPEASDKVLERFAAEHISWHADTVIERLDPSRHVAVTASGEALSYDLFLGVPAHQVPSVVSVAGLCRDGWVPVNPATMETIHRGVYAIGDIVDIGAPKAGVFAEAQAAVASAHILARLRGLPDPERVADRGICYLDIGAGATTGIDVTFTPGTATKVVLHEPSEDTTAARDASTVARIRRWFPQV